MRISIDNGSELFGSATLMPDGSRAINGFEALKALDTNGDGVISPADSSWSSIKLWLDSNYDGYTERGELVSLDRMGIQSINLNYVSMMEVDPNGNQTRERSTFRRNMGGTSTALQIIDIWFDTLWSRTSLISVEIDWGRPRPGVP